MGVSQVSLLTRELDQLVADFRRRPLAAGPYTFCWLDALTGDDGARWLAFSHRPVARGPPSVRLVTPDCRTRDAGCSDGSEATACARSVRARLDDGLATEPPSLRSERDGTEHRTQRWTVRAGTAGVIAPAAAVLTSAGASAQSAAKKTTENSATSVTE